MRKKKKKSLLNCDIREKIAVLRTRVSFRLVRCVANASELARAAVSCAIRFKVVERVLMKNKMKIYLNCNILETKWSILVNRVNGTFSIIVRHSFQGYWARINEERTENIQHCFNIMGTKWSILVNRVDGSFRENRTSVTVIRFRREIILPLVNDKLFTTNKIILILV